MPHQHKEEQEDIVEQLPYLNELMQAIRNINDAILQEKDARDAAENLISDLPDEWRLEIEEKLNIEIKKYNNILSIQNKFLIKGYSESQKVAARNAIRLAGIDYARNTKKIVITLLKKMNLLFKTKKQVEKGALSIWKEGDEIDD